MEFVTTRHQKKYLLDHAIIAGLAPDGGLYVPEQLPKFPPESLCIDQSYPAFAADFLRPFFAGSALLPELDAICADAFNFPLPVKPLDDYTNVLELFHGPTLSFKDFGARFLAECLSRLSKDKQRTILVATSGDTGSAVASAFYQKPNLNVVVLFPKGKISARQEQQITCWGENVKALAVEGDFDDCQRLVKQAFADEACQQANLTTANSINIARLLPQTVYYAYTSLEQLAKTGAESRFIIPSGNLGHATAAFWAKHIGMPITEIVIACNANRPVTDYLTTGRYEAKITQATLANAMDVGNPSNFERLQYLLPSFNAFKSAVQAFNVSDARIEACIKECFLAHHYLLCPHTATAYAVRQQMSEQLHYTLVATAHASKFEQIVEPLIAQTIEMPASLQTIMARQVHVQEMPAELSALRSVLP